MSTDRLPPDDQRRARMLADPEGHSHLVLPLSRHWRPAHARDVASRDVPAGPTRRMATSTRCGNSSRFLLNEPARASERRCATRGAVQALLLIADGPVACVLWSQRSSPAVTRVIRRCPLTRLSSPGPAMRRSRMATSADGMRLDKPRRSSEGTSTARLADTVPAAQTGVIRLGEPALLARALQATPAESNV